MTENEENVKRKKNPVITDDDKNTKMHYFAAEGNISELTEEIKIYQKIDPENYLGWTPLLMACRNGHKAAVNLLLQHHADATKKNKFGMSVFLVSIASGDLELVHQILQHLLCGGVSRQSLQHIFSPISLAILFCHQHILQYLISQNFAINIATHITGVTPIMFAAAMENSEAYSLLIAKGADPKVKNCSGFSTESIMEYKSPCNEVNPKSPAMVVQKPSQLPPHLAQVPYIVISPQPSYIQLPSAHMMPCPHLRKSSNTMSPSPNYYFATPNVTPISPVPLMMQSQMFFPPDFSANQFYTTNANPNVLNSSNDFLNARINQNNMFLSPLPQANFPSPCT